MKYNYLQQIETSAGFLSTEIFRIYYSRIPKEVDMNAISPHGSQFYKEDQHHTDNPPETLEAAAIQKPLHLVESVVDHSSKNNEIQMNLPEPVDTMLMSRPENNIYSIDDSETDKNDVAHYYHSAVGEAVNLSHSQVSDNPEVWEQPAPQSDNLVQTIQEITTSEEEMISVVASSLTNDSNQVKSDSKETENDIPASIESIRIEDDNFVRMRFDSVVERLPEEKVDLEKVTSVETKDNQSEVKETSYENTFSLFHKLATPEKDRTVTTDEAAVGATPAKESQLESKVESSDITSMKAGAYLSLEREKSRLSVQQIADKLYLDVNLIKALEADNYEQLPPPIFIRGYIRNYAKLLRIPAEPLLTAYERSGQATLSTPVITPQLTPKKQTTSSDWRFKAVTYTIIIALMMLMALWQYYPTSSESPETINVPDGPAWENFQPLETPPTLPPPAIVETNPANLLNVPPPSGETPSAVVAPPPPTGAPDTQPATTEPTATTTESPTTAEPQPQSLQIHFKQAVWTKLTDSKGKVLYNQTGKSGEVFSIQEGIPPFYLSVGNEGLQVEYQGSVKNITAYPKQKNKSKTFIIGGNE